MTIKSYADVDPTGNFDPACPVTQFHSDALTDAESGFLVLKWAFYLALVVLGGIAAFVVADWLISIPGDGK